MTAVEPATSVLVPPGDLAGAVTARVAGGGRFAGLVAFAAPRGAVTLRALVAVPGRLDVLAADLPAGEWRYPALTPRVPAASWYEREIHDLFGLEAAGHPRLDPLVFPTAGAEDGTAGLSPGRPDGPEAVDFDPSPLPGHVAGEGVFTIPYGPVRSGVFESVEYLVETYGEDIPHLRVRVYPKHRGVARRFAGLSFDDGVLLAERVEGTAPMAHASAFCQALESLAGVEPPARAQLLRVVHAELERVGNHLDSVIRHTEGAGQAVAYARMSLHKERVLRLQGELCGHRFGRGVVVPGGVASGPRCPVPPLLGRIEALQDAVAGDARTLMGTPSFVDRLHGTGVLTPELVAGHGGLGPLGRASGLAEDIRASRPYGAYLRLGFAPVDARVEGDAQARQQVRLDEIEASFGLAREALDLLADEPEGPWRAPVEGVDGVAAGSVESPQGELIYLVEARDGRVVQAKGRCAAFHNLALFPNAFGGDIFTDFVFIEASFGLSVAGAAG
ncbi:MAG: NADH-quinone oxidoreductase subunit C [Acidimicrobiales bacterium]